MAAEKEQIFLGDPDHIAQGLLNTQFIFDPGDETLKGGAFTLRWWRSDFYRWLAGCWRRLADAEIKRTVAEYVQDLNDRAPKQDQISISTNRVNNVLLNLTGRIGIPESIELDSWPAGREENAFHTIAVANGLLMLNPEGGAPMLVPHTPDWFSTTKLPYDYNGEAKCSRWLAFLDEVMLGRQDYVELLQQWTGYLFRPDLREHKFLLCVGKGSNGKTVLFDVIEALMGKVNSSHVSLSQLYRPFAPYATVGKTVNLTSESSRLIEDEAENVLKTLVSGDRTDFERKFKDPVSTRPTAKWMVATNDLPRFRDRTMGIWRRILLVPFDKVIAEDAQVIELADQLKTELSGILNWALEGLKSLNQNRFVKPEDSAKLLEEYRKLADPARAFLVENYGYTPNGEGTSCNEVYEKYKEFCHDNNCRPMYSGTFGRHVKQVFPAVKCTRPGGSGSRGRFYEGLTSALNEPDADLCGPETESESKNDETLPF